MKYSKQRELILNTVLENPIHPTADQVYHLLKINHPNLSLGTVYRNLNLLAQTGEIVKLAMEGGPDRFDGRLNDHFHLKCRVCGNVIDIEENHLHELLSQAVDRIQGHKVDAVKVLFEGVCTDCLEDKN